MIGPQINPYAIYVRCDASMSYEPHNPGGVGIHITFPENVDLPEMIEYIGRYEGSNIERLELKAISKGIELLTDIFNKESVLLNIVRKVIIVTDRESLDDSKKTSAYHIRDWRHNQWRNDEDKPIKNSDLLDEIDKKRKKLSQLGRCYVEIQYQRRKNVRKADKAAGKGRQRGIVDRSIEIKGLKISKRKYSGANIDYKQLKEGQKLPVRIYKKQPVDDEWEISAELFEGNNREEKVVIFTDNSNERKLHRHHKYQITIDKVFRHHIRMKDDFKEVIE